MSLNKFSNTSIGKEVKLKIGCEYLDSTDIVCQNIIADNIIIQNGGDIITENLTVTNKLLVETKDNLGFIDYTTSDLGQPNFSLHTNGNGTTFWSPDDTGSVGITYNGSLPIDIGKIVTFSSTDGKLVGKSNLLVNSLGNLDIIDNSARYQGLYDYLNPSELNSLSAVGYVDQQNDLKVNKSGDTMTGDLITTNIRTTEFNVHLGLDAGVTQSGKGVAIGSEAGNVQGDCCVAIGCRSGKISQGNESIAIGLDAGENILGTSCVAIGTGAGKSNSTDYSLYIGHLAGINANNFDGSVVLSGSSSVINPTADNQLLIKSGTSLLTHDAGGLTTNIDIESTSTTTGSITTVGGVGIGKNLNVGGEILTTNIRTAGTQVHLGSNAGVSNQGTNSVGIGLQAGFSNQGDEAVALGYRSGRSSQGNNSIAIGNSAGDLNLGLNAIVIGTQSEAVDNSIAIGDNAKANGTNSISIGPLSNSINNNCILLGAMSNQSGGTLTSIVDESFYVNPIRNASGTENLLYNTITKEVTHVPYVDVEAQVITNTTDIVTLQDKTSQISKTGTQTDFNGPMSSNQEVRIDSNSTLEPLFIAVKNDAISSGEGLGGVTILQETTGTGNIGYLKWIASENYIGNAGGNNFVVRTKQNGSTTSTTRLEIKSDNTTELNGSIVIVDGNILLNNQIIETPDTRGDFDAGLSSTLYEDIYVMLKWNSANKQPVFEIKTGYTGYWDVTFEVVKGNNSIYSNDDINTLVTDEYYFTGSTTFDSAYNAINYSTKFICTLQKENTIPAVPCYYMIITTGSIAGSGFYKLDIIKPSGLLNISNPRTSTVYGVSSPKISNQTRIEYLENRLNELVN